MGYWAKGVKGKMAKDNLAIVSSCLLAILPSKERY